MRTPSFFQAVTVFALLSLLLVSGGSTTAQGPGPQGVLAPQTRQGTAFTYQGQLKNVSSPVNGNCDFQFSLWDSLSNTSGQIGTTQTKTNVSVTAGLFTIPDLDFGSAAFAGDARWLKVAVRCPAGSGDYTSLSPRQALTASPYALSLKPGAVISTTEHFGRAALRGQVGPAYGELGREIYGGVPPYEVDIFYGVYGSSSSGTGVYGEGPIGVQAVAADDQGIALFANGKVGIGTLQPTAMLDVAGTAAANVVQIRGGSDLAEKFGVEGQAIVEPGTLMVIDEDHAGKLRPSQQPYDTRVAGIASGAGGVQPGLTLQQVGVMEGNTSVAIAGRVYVKAEALSSPIQPGDLLTSSSIPGHAMKATDQGRAPGAIIGKAMSALTSGQCLVLVLVSLQ